MGPSAAKRARSAPEAAPRAKKSKSVSKIHTESDDEDPELEVASATDADVCEFFGFAIEDEDDGDAMEEEEDEPDLVEDASQQIATRYKHLSKRVIRKPAAFAPSTAVPRVPAGPGRPPFSASVHYPEHTAKLGIAPTRANCANKKCARDAKRLRQPVPQPSLACAACKVHLCIGRCFAEYHS